MGGSITQRGTYALPHLCKLPVCQSPSPLHDIHATQFFRSSLVTTSFSMYPPLHRPSLAHTFVPAHSIMARFVMPSLTPHYANNSPWSVSVNLTFAQAEDFLRQFFSAVSYHLHTAILFTWTDYKTIFLPIVSIIFLLCV